MDFKIDFQMDLLRKKYFIFKIKEINLKTTKHEKQTTKPNKRKTKSQNGIFYNRTN